MILDGYGVNENPEHNAIAMADTPVMDRLKAEYPYVKGYASGLAVGLPDGQMGNSEVGHLNIGAGRVVYQELTRITKEIQDGDFFRNEELLAAIENCKEYGSALHLYGLVSDGGVHSHNTHLYALLKLAKEQGLERVYVHAFLDGRDVPPTSGAGYVEELVQKMREIGVGRVATVQGRYYAMDRDNRWERIEKAWNALVKGEGKYAADPVQAIRDSYAAGVTDEFVEPVVICPAKAAAQKAQEADEDAADTGNACGILGSNGLGGAVETIGPNDSIIFFNFRPDRARQITRAFCDDEFTGFERGERFPVCYVCFTDYDVTIQNKRVAFKKQEITNTFGEWLAANGLKQLRIAETEKYAHVTFFFNGGIEAPNEGEDRILVPSPKVATYDLQPEMSAYGVTDKLVEAIESGKYDVIICNYANSDMVGHTGVESAAVAAVEAVDACVGRVYDAVMKAGGQMFICADHGNSDQMVDYETGEPFTQHTTNPVPFVLVNADPSWKLREGGKLCDIVPTLIEMMGMEKPAEMTGESLIVRG